MRRIGWVGVVLAFIAGTCGAAIYTWTGNGGDGKLSTFANWEGNPDHFTADDMLIFTNGDALAVTADSAMTVGTVAFNGAGAVTVGGTGTLTVTKVISTSAAVSVINCPVAFSGGYLVDFETAAVKFAGGATATFPDPATTDNAASHALTGQITFTADWTQGKIAYPYTVPADSKLYGKHVTGTSIEGTADINPYGLMLAIAEGGYAEFDSVTVGDKVARISIRGHMKVNGIFQAGTDVADGNSHVGFDGDEAYPAVLEASGILKGSHRQVYVKPATIYIGKDGFGALQPDYTFHFDGGDKVIYATDNFEVVGPLNSGNIYDWGVAIDKAVVLDTQGYTVTWTGAVTGAGAFTKAGAGTLIMKPNGCNLSTPITISGGKVVVANQRGFGTSSLSFASGTVLELDNPDMTTMEGPVALAADTTVAFHLAEGRLQGRLGTVTASGAVTVTIDGAAGAEGVVYPLTVGAGLSQTDFEKFTLAGRDDLALSLSATGDIVATVISSDITVSSYTYAAANGSEAVWSEGIAAWTLAGEGAKVAFGAGGNALFAGVLDSAVQSVSVPDTLQVGNVTIATDSDLTLTGEGTLAGMGNVVKTGRGTLTLDGANFGDQTFTITAGKVTLGPLAGANSLGSDSGSSGGSVTIGDGAQFNLNYIGENTEGGNNNSARAAITQLKTFVISGDGPDHRGAIVNDATDRRETHNAAWNAAFRRIELVDDATIGGIDRFDVRKHGSTPATAAGGIFGPGKKLTVKNTGFFGLVGLPINVESVLITEGGVFRPEEVPSVTIPGGITLDHGTLHGYNTTFPETVSMTVTEDGGAFSSQSGTTAINAPVVMAEGAALALEGSGGGINYNAGIVNNGSITVTGGSHNFVSGKLEGDGTWEQTGGSLYFYQTADLVSPKTLNLSGGTFFYGKETSGAGKLNQKLTVNATGGNFGFNLGASTTITKDDVVFNGTPAIQLYTKNDRSVVGRFEDLTLLSGNIGTGAGGSMGNYTFGNGTVIETETFLVNRSGDGLDSVVRVEEGASLTVGNNLTVGDAAGGNEYRLIVEGGKVVCQGTSPLHMGYQAKGGYFDFFSGEMEVPGIWCRIGWWDPLTYNEQFTMNGGVLTITGAHETEPAIGGYTRFNPFIQLNNGTILSAGDWDVQQLLAVSFGERAGGTVTLDLADRSIDWATGLTGAADVRLTGSGAFLSGVGNTAAIRFQGAPTGNWSIENSGVNDLYGAAAFLGGLHLAEDVSATISIGGSNLVEAVFLKTGSGKFEEACTWSNAYPFVCNDLTFLHARGEEKDYNNSIVMWQGQFYADTAGVWTFAGGYDDSVRIDVDGEKVMECTSWSAVDKGSVSLTVGWHDFRIVQYQAGGGWGAVPSGWANVMNVGFAKRLVDNTTAANYLPFDADHLPLRAGPVTGVGGTVNWHVVHEKSDWATRTDWTFESVTNKLSMLDIYNVALPETIGNSVHMFDGWVYVPVTKTGDWQIHLDFDDWASLKIDGVDSGANGQNNEAGHKGMIPGVTTGWHRFELRVCDTGGNWGPWSGTAGQAKNPLATVTVNDVTYKFDETGFRFSHLKPVEYAGLDGEICLDEGSTLSNRAGSACPIWGTLTGTGTLNGPFAFAGEANAWRVAGIANSRVLGCVQFNEPDYATLKALRKVEAVFNGKPTVPTYDMGPALGADPDAIALEVTDEDGNDYTEQFSLVVQNGALYLKNARPSGMAVIIH